ncbi:MAG: transposase [Candidatus Kapabacteria bacterium]|nr:transposase [Candidatus Kapabacteria bacterium]
MMQKQGRRFLPQIYHDLHQAAEPPTYGIVALFRGLGSRNLELVTEALMDSFGLSKSRVSELFVEHSAAILEEFLQRRLDESTYVAVFIDGKCIQGQNIVSVIGVTEAGEKYRWG